MNTDFSDLSLMQISDSFFPTGLYTMSNGLETLFSEKRIASIDELYELIQTNIVQQIGPADCVALANAYNFTGSKDPGRRFFKDNLPLPNGTLLYSNRNCMEVDA